MTSDGLDLSRSVLVLVQEAVADRPEVGKRRPADLHCTGTGNAAAATCSSGQIGDCLKSASVEHRN